MQKYPFYTALSHLREMYGVELDEDTFETYGMVAWNKIGNKDYKMYQFLACPVRDCDGSWYVDIPCNLNAIEAITLPFEDALETHVLSNNHIANTAPVENSIEPTKHMRSELYIPGKFVKYKELGDKIYFTEPYPKVNVLYKGLYADEDGLPYLNDKELNAIALYCAFAHHYKQGIMQKDLGTLNIAGLLKADWLRACDAARVAPYFSQNDMNEILSVMTSFNRSGYGRTYKPIS